MRRGLVILVVLCAVVAAPQAHATLPGSNGKIAYSLTRPVNPSDPEAGVITEIWTSNQDGTNARRIVTGESPAWSPDGAKLAIDGISTINEDGTGGRFLTRGTDPAWSPDGQQIVFDTGGRFGDGQLRIVDADGTGERPVGTLCDGWDPDWSADNRIVFTSACLSPPGLYVVDPDGSNLQYIAPRLNKASWSPGQVWIAGSYPGFGIDRLAMHAVDPPGPRVDIGSAESAAWSPDGTRFVVDGGTVGPGGVIIVDAAGNFVQQVTTENGDEPAWQPIAPNPTYPGYARPNAATRFHVPLVPAYAPCEAPNRTHGPPLGLHSCNPPRQSSSTLTVGTADANGRASRSLGYLQLNVVPSDLRMDFQVTDVRCRTSLRPCTAGVLSDYAGSVEATYELQITDRFNGGSGLEPATVQTISGFLLPFRLRVACSPTSDTGVGSTCATSTSANALTPSAARAGKRATWELSAVRVNDSGPDGEITSDDNEVFAVQGVFVP